MEFRRDYGFRGGAKNIFRSSSPLELQLPVIETVSESERGEKRREKEERREERKRRGKRKNQAEKVRAKDISTTDRRDRENWCLPL